MIKVLIADDQQLIRESLQLWLENKEDVVITGAASNGAEVLESIEKEKPDVILMDIRMPKKIKQQYPHIKIIILTTFDDDMYVYNALKYGASGYLLKGIALDDLYESIKTVYNGQSMINPDIASKVLKFFYEMANQGIGMAFDNKHEENLTAAEWKIVREIEKGASNKEIAAALCLSEGTVRNYITAILDKLELRDRTQLAIWAVQMSLSS